MFLFLLASLAISSSTWRASASDSHDPDFALRQLSDDNYTFDPFDYQNGTGTEKEKPSSENDDPAATYFPRHDCVDFTGFNNPECYKNMLWAQEEAKTIPENYPPGSETLADFQCALYLKGDINGTNQPGPVWNCTLPPCAKLHAPVKFEGGTPGSKGTVNCVHKAPNLMMGDTGAAQYENCSVANGSGPSMEYPCLCQGDAAQTCRPGTYCWPAPFFCNENGDRRKFGISKPQDLTHPPTWAWVAIAFGLACVLAAIVLGVMKFMGQTIERPKRPRSSAVMKQASAYQAGREASAPSVSQPSIAPAQYVYTREPVITRSVPMATYSTPSSTPAAAYASGPTTYKAASGAVPASTLSTSYTAPAYSTTAAAAAGPVALSSASP